YPQSYLGFLKSRAVAPALLQWDHHDYCQGGTVSFRRAGVLFAAIAIVAGAGVAGLRAQDASSEMTRRAKVKVAPEYPDLARKMNITGTVKIQIVVAPNGTVKDAKVLGGHPVLAGAALDAVRKWRFEPAQVESSGVVELKFEPHQ
ncbi:MAG: energy transducer TonB, partial [Candidatus Sulfotelmatobacter sp.]